MWGDTSVLRTSIGKLNTTPWNATDNTNTAPEIQTSRFNFRRCVQLTNLVSLANKQAILVANKMQEDTYVIILHCTPLNGICWQLAFRLRGA